MEIIPWWGWLVLFFNFAISIWNAYAAGYNLGLAKRYNIQGFLKAAIYAGLGISFAGMAYVLIIILSYIAYTANYITLQTLAFLFAFNFLVFGLLIVVFGIIVAIESIIIAVKTKNIWDIFVAIWNSFASIWNAYTYISGFQTATSIVGSYVGSEESRKDTAAIFVIIVAALLIAFFILYAAYRAGYKKAESVQISVTTEQPSPA